jgi:phospholipid/cholesterol/gamma-HCH transport system ATP-binding protein
MDNQKPEINLSSEHIQVQDLTIAYGNDVIQKDINFSIKRREIFVIMGGSGCGKSSLLKVLIGLKAPAGGRVIINDCSFWEAAPEQQTRLKRSFGVMFQSGALWSSLTLTENIALPLAEFTSLGEAERNEVAAFKLALVGLAGYGAYYPSEISGGMQKRASLARAMALDPEILFFDEPSAGLDPVSSRRLDELIVELSESLKTTIVVVTHELASIFAIAKNSVYLDNETGTMLETGDPRTMINNSRHARVRAFLSRGELS